MIFLSSLSYMLTTIRDLWNNREGCQRFGRKQSPINIVSDHTEYDDLLRTFPIDVDYKTEHETTVLNTGHSLKAKIIQTSTVSGGPFDDTYQLVQFHLHWGATDLTGSEHTVEGRQFSAELHLVHYNAERYESFIEARDRPKGLAVLGVLLKVGKEHPLFSAITGCICDVIDPHQTTYLPRRFNPKCLLPDDFSQYWTYPGSLTSFPYSETVTWVVFRQPIEVSHAQLEALRSLRGSHERPGSAHISDNFRNTCPLGNRSIRASFRY